MRTHNKSPGVASTDAIICRVIDLFINKCCETFGFVTNRMLVYDCVEHSPLCLASLFNIFRHESEIFAQIDDKGRRRDYTYWLILIHTPSHKYTYNTLIKTDLLFWIRTHHKLNCLMGFVFFVCALRLPSSYFHLNIMRIKRSIFRIVFILATNMHRLR